MSICFIIWGTDFSALTRRTLVKNPGLSSFMKKDREESKPALWLFHKRLLPVLFSLVWSGQGSEKGKIIYYHASVSISKHLNLTTIVCLYKCFCLCITERAWTCYFALPESDRPNTVTTPKTGGKSDGICFQAHGWSSVEIHSEVLMNHHVLSLCDCSGNVNYLSSAS